MATIKARCATCGDLDLGPADVRLTVAGKDAAWFEFECLLCGDLLSRDADPVTVLLLVTAGVVAHAGLGPITEAEIAEFAAALEDGALEALLGSS